MRFVATKTAEQQSCLTLHRTRHLFIRHAIQIAALPLHLLALPTAAATETTTATEKRSPVHLHRDEYTTFGLLAAVLTLGAAVLSIVGTQLLPLLTARGISMSAAVAFGAIVGLAQVGARVFELLIGNRCDPVWTIVASATLVALSAVMLTLGSPIISIAIVLYGAGNGIGSVARGTVPLALFGAERYPVLMGRLGLPLLLAMAVSPYLGALAFQQGGADWTLVLLTVLAVEMSSWWGRCVWLRGHGWIVFYGRPSMSSPGATWK
jgi:hypothetical protein